MIHAYEYMYHARNVLHHHEHFIFSILSSAVTSWNSCVFRNKQESCGGCEIVQQPSRYNAKSLDREIYRSLTCPNFIWSNLCVTHTWGNYSRSENGNFLQDGTNYNYPIPVCRTEKDRVAHLNHAFPITLKSFWCIKNTFIDTRRQTSLDFILIEHNKSKTVTHPTSPNVPNATMN